MKNTITLLLCVVMFAIEIDLSGASEIEFSRDIRAVLSNKCFLCHGPDETNRKADLRLDIREDAITAGAFEPGDASASEILARITSDDPELVMPPPATGKAVTKAEAALFRQWIDDGAPYLSLIHI